jgi:hypothetical protein
MFHLLREMNRARSERNRRRRGCLRNRKQNGAGLGTSYSFLGSVDPNNPGLGNAAEVSTFSSCQNAPRPGYIDPAPIRGGLPGFSGGRRRTQRKRRGNRKMYGGVYTFDPQVVGDVNVAVPGRPYAGCGEGAYAQPNPLAGADARLQITAPPGIMSAVPGIPIPGLQKGGMAPYIGANNQSLHGSDAMVYEAPRAGYSQWPSDTAGGNAGTLADGKTPFEVNVPYTALPNPSSACLKTGGGRRKNRKSRKNRKASRKSLKKRRSC